MRQDIKQEWVAALRDPEAKQLRGKLGNSEGARCCLGVLCDIAVKHGVIKPPVEQDDGSLTYGDTKDNPEYNEDEECFSDWVSDGELPKGVVLWSELSSDEQSIAPDDTTDGVHLAGWNDGVDTARVHLRPHTFPEIADLIEENL